MSYLLLKALCNNLFVAADVLLEADASTDVGHEVRHAFLNRVAVERKLRRQILMLRLRTRWPGPEGKEQCSVKHLYHTIG